MAPIDIVARWFAGFLPAYPADAVAKASDSLGDAVLWAGPASRPETVDRLTHIAAWSSICFLVAGAMIAGIFLALLQAYRDQSRAAPSVSTVGTSLITVVCLVAFGILGIAISMSEANGWADRAYLVTPTRIVRLQGDQRTDFPATAIAAVSRDADGLLVRTADGQVLKVQTAPADRAALEGAMDRVVEETGKGSRVLRERHG